MTIAIGFLVMLGAVSLMAHRRTDVITRYDSKTNFPLKALLSMHRYVRRRDVVFAISNDPHIVGILL